MECVKLHNEGMSQRMIATALHISRGGVENILRKALTGKCVNDLPKSGRPRKLSKRTEKFIVVTSKRHPKLTARQLSSTCNVLNKASLCTVKRILRRAKLFGRIAVKKPFLSKVHRQKRLAWCRERRLYNETDWGRIIFTDESKIELHPRRRLYVRRAPGCRINPSMVAPTTKFSPSIMVWGAIRRDGKRVLCRCDASVDQYEYQRILNAHLSSIYRPRFVFQQDGARAHTAHSTIEFLQRKQIRLLPQWPAQSPDLSPIEHVWDILKERVAQRGCSTLGQLWESITDEWNKISNDEIRKLYDSMPRRIVAVLRAHGGNTKY
jgi:transposase